jgi:hypothetical protein
MSPNAYQASIAHHTFPCTVNSSPTVNHLISHKPKQKPKGNRTTSFHVTHRQEEGFLESAGQTVLRKSLAGRSGATAIILRFSDLLFLPRTMVASRKTPAQLHQAFARPSSRRSFVMPLGYTSHPLEHLQQEPGPEEIHCS